MTERNVERTGKRKVTRLSAIARQVENVRHYDQDLYQVCPDCKFPQLFAEVKSRDVSEREWEQTRRFAMFYGRGCLALLVVEPPDSEKIGVRIFSSHSGLISPLTWGGEGYLKVVLKGARDRHECY